MRLYYCDRPTADAVVESVWQGYSLSMVRRPTCRMSEMTLGGRAHALLVVRASAPRGVDRMVVAQSRDGNRRTRVHVEVM